MVPGAIIWEEAGTVPIRLVVDGVKVLGDGLNVTANVRARTDYQDFSGVMLTNLDARIRGTCDR